MTQEEEKLLTKDLCGRLPYEVKVDHFGVVRELLEVIPASFPCASVMVGYDINDYEDSVIEDIKPYLRPMWSMTEEEDNELNYARMGNYGEDVDWLLEHHFDYRGLIEMGLALEAPEGMYKTV